MVKMGLLWRGQIRVLTHAFPRPPRPSWGPVLPSVGGTIVRSGGGVPQGQGGGGIYQSHPTQTVHAAHPNIHRFQKGGVRSKTVLPLALSSF